MFTEEITACLEQKEILLTRILDLTKRIEVRCQEPEVDLGHFLDQRAALMERVNKCNRLVDSRLEQMEPQERERCATVMELRIPKAGCADETEQKAFSICTRILSLFEQAAAIDRSARESLRLQSEEAKKKLSELRTPKKQPELFSSDR
jgi:hypothetical protein